MTVGPLLNFRQDFENENAIKNMSATVLPSFFCLRPSKYGYASNPEIDAEPLIMLMRSTIWPMAHYPKTKKIVLTQHNLNTRTQSLAFQSITSH